MAQRLPIVFISATSADLGIFRRAVRDELLTCRIFPDLQDHFPPDFREIEAKLRPTVAQCDAVICLVGRVFGAAPRDRPKRSYTQLEYKMARKLKKPLFVFLARDGYIDKLPPEGEGLRLLQEAHRKGIQKSKRFYGEFTTVEELRRLVAELSNRVHELTRATPPPTEAIDLLPGLRELPGLQPDTPLDVALERLLAVSLAPLISWLARPPETDGAQDQPHEIAGISRGYWDNAQLFSGELVKIAGSVSSFAPLFVGPPLVKRDLHRRYREQIDPKDASGHRSLIDAKLGFSAGQMVWRLNLDWLDFVYLGVYRSIVRNSIPVFVRRKTFAEQLKPHLDRHRTHVVESEVTGRLGPILPYGETLKSIGLKTQDFADLRLHNCFAIFVDAEADQATGIRVLGQGRYLDGDIWASVRQTQPDGGQEDLLLNMPGVDLSDREDFDSQLSLLARRICKDHPRCDLIYEFDQVQRPRPDVPQILKSMEAMRRLGNLGSAPD